MGRVTERTIEALVNHPHLLESLAAGVLNAAAAARMLEVEGVETDAVAAALRRMTVETNRGTEHDEPRIRVDRTLADDRWSRMMPTAVGDDSVGVVASGVRLPRHRELLGRLFVRGVDLRASRFGAGEAEYVVATDDLHRTIAAIETPMSPGVGVAIDSSADRDNDR